MKKLLITMRFRRLLLLATALALPFGSTYAATVISDGGVNYSLTTSALSHMTTEVVLTMGYVVGLLYAIASLLAIYNATVIYIKLNAGEEGFTKSVMMLVGAIIFLIGATVILPAFFGYQASSSGYSLFS